MACSLETARISLEDCTCPVCMCILIEPVTMPCHHELCRPCFKQNVEEASLLCPLCRTRIATWARHSTKTNTLVNQQRWKQIQKLFPKRVRLRLEGKDEEEEDSHDVSYHHPHIHLAEPGEIRREYEEELRKLRQQMRQERSEEEKESEALIWRLQREADRDLEQLHHKQEQIANADEELAKELSKVINSVHRPLEFQDDLEDNHLLEDAKSRLTRSNSAASNSSSNNNGGTLETFFSKYQAESATRCPSDPYAFPCVSPSAKHKGGDNSKLFPDSVTDHSLRNHNAVKSSTTARPPSNGGSNVSHSSSEADKESDRVRSDRDRSESAKESADSNDSITNELAHFKPIASCPRTPPRKMADGKIIDPPVVRTTPRNLSRNGFGSPVDHMSSPGLETGSPIMQRRLSELAHERQLHVHDRSKSTSTGPNHEYLAVSASGETTLPPDTFPSSSAADTVGSNPGWLIPLESIIEDNDYVDITDLLKFTNSNDSVVPKSKKNEHASNTSNHPTNHDTDKHKRPRHKSRDEKTRILSPQRSIKDWFKTGDVKCETISPDLFLTSVTDDTGLSEDHVHSRVGACHGDTHIQKTIDKKYHASAISNNNMNSKHKQKHKASFGPDCSKSHVNTITMDEDANCLNSEHNHVDRTKNRMKTISSAGDFSVDEDMLNGSDVIELDSASDSDAYTRTEIKKKKVKSAGEGVHKPTAQKTTRTPQHQKKHVKQAAACLSEDENETNMKKEARRKGKKTKNRSESKLTFEVEKVNNSKSRKNVKKVKNYSEDTSPVKHDTRRDTTLSEKEPDVQDRENCVLESEDEFEVSTAQTSPKKKRRRPRKGMKQELGNSERHQDEYKTGGQKQVGRNKGGCLKRDLLSHTKQTHTAKKRKFRRRNSDADFMASSDDDCESDDAGACCKKIVTASSENIAKQGRKKLKTGDCDMNYMPNASSDDGSFNDAATPCKKMVKKGGKTSPRKSSLNVQFSEVNTPVKKRKGNCGKSLTDVNQSPCSDKHSQSKKCGTKKLLENVDPNANLNRSPESSPVKGRGTRKRQLCQSEADDRTRVSPRKKSCRKRDLSESDAVASTSTGSRGCVNPPKGRRHTVCTQPSITRYLSGSGETENLRSPDSDVFDSTTMYNQEEEDRKMALKLQRQFNLEEKFKIDAERFKGGCDQYHFRRKPKYTM